ncbi:MAG: class I SAM-dependent methyltransferase [Acidimicrobiales bacterium]
MGLSGYQTYTRESSNAEVSAYILWRFFGDGRVLDVGCAMGWVVECLRETGLDAQGVDFSHFAVEASAPGATGHISQGDLLAGLDFPDRSFDTIAVLETLEHLPPEEVPTAIAELARLCRGWVYATIPSFGPNSSGPDGWLDGKVKPERLEYYRSLGPDYLGPIPPDDLYLDANGLPVEGHLTIASFNWWQARFEEAGLQRSRPMETRIMAEVDRFAFTGYWNVYALHMPGVNEDCVITRSAESTLALERRWGLDPDKGPPRIATWMAPTDQPGPAGSRRTPGPGTAPTD